jgi:hypothetical protein
MSPNQLSFDGIFFMKAIVRLVLPAWSFSHLVQRALSVSILIFAALPFSPQLALAQFTQQGPPLFPTGLAMGPLVQQGFSVALSADGNTALVGAPRDGGSAGAAFVYARNGGVWTPVTALRASDGGGYVGDSVSLSADGNTALVGGYNDNGGIGAAWVFTRSGGVWNQQGTMLVGAGYSNGGQGWSVAISGDGNTAIIGSIYDGAENMPDTGAAWVFTQSGGVWTQQGSKLVGTGSNGAEQGASVALSYDGNTAIVGGPAQSPGGAVWIYTRSGGVWTEQASALSANSDLNASQGMSVSLSADGNTALVGAPNDTAGTGAAWVFTRSGGVWTLQNPSTPLVGTGAVGNASSGYSVALSADGKTAIVGGYNDNGGVGAAWVYTLAGGVWTQQGSKLVGTSYSGGPNQGWSVALSEHGNTAIIGGPLDDPNYVSGVTGRAWVFFQPTLQPTNTHDFNGDGKSDIAWRDNVGDLAIWLMNGTAVLSSGGVGGIPTTWSIVGQRDFNGDGMADLLWRDTSGDTAMWFMNGTTVAAPASVGNVSTNWTVVGVADFNGDGLGDLLWRDSSGDIAVWLMSGATVMSSAPLGNVPTTWTVAGTGDFNGDGMSDILWRDNAGDMAIWFMNGTTVASSAGVGNVPTNWSVVGTGDFNGNGMADIVWRDNVGDTSIWLMNGATVSSAVGLGQIPVDWQIVETGDFNGDGTSDVLWFSSTFGVIAMWFMSEGQIAQSAGVGFIGAGWTIQNTNAD